MGALYKAATGLLYQGYGKVGWNERDKDGNTAMTRILAKTDVENMEMVNLQLKEQVEKLVDTNVEWSKDAKCFEKLASTENVIFSVENKRKLLVSNVDRLEKSEIQLGKENTKKNHAKRLLSEITKENTKNVGVAADQKKVASVKIQNWREVG